MRFFLASAWASSLAAWVLIGAGNAAAQAGGTPEFRVDPSTVTAGRTLTVLCRTRKSLKEGRVVVGATEARFYKTGWKRWRALVGISATEPVGPHTAIVNGRLGAVEFQSEIDFFVAEGSYPVSLIQLAPAKDALFTNGAVDRDAERLAAVFNEPGSPKKLWDGAFLWPSTGVVSSVFGARRSYGGRPATGSHSGVDLANAAGTPVLAPARGRVVLAEWLESFGNVVMLDHGQGVYSYYLHMQSANVTVGQTVKRDRLLGLMGQEGVATGPHVHWSVAVAGVRVDPMEWVERSIR